MTIRRLALTLGAAVALSCAFIADILTGPALLSVSEVLTALFAPETAERTALAIVNAIRWPVPIRSVSPRPPGSAPPRRSFQAPPCRFGPR